MPSLENKMFSDRCSFPSKDIKPYKTHTQLKATTILDVHLGSAEWLSTNYKKGQGKCYPIYWISDLPSSLKD